MSKYETYALADLVVWTFILFIDAAHAGVPSHEDRHDRLDNTLGGSILFALPLQTVSILNLYGVEDAIERVGSEPTHVLEAYEWSCGIE